MELQKSENTPVRMQQITRPLSWWKGEGKTFILRNGEIGVATRGNEPPIMKIGNGIGIWNELADSVGSRVLVEDEDNKSVQIMDLSEAKGFGAIALGGLRYDFLQYKYYWDLTATLQDNSNTIISGHYYMSDITETPTIQITKVASISTTLDLIDKEIVSILGVNYSISIIPPSITDEGAIVAPVITLTKEDNTTIVFDAEYLPYAGGEKTIARGKQSFAAGGSTLADGPWSAAFGKTTKAYGGGSQVEGGGTQAGYSYEEFKAKQATELEGKTEEEILTLYNSTYKYWYAHAQNETTKAYGRGSDTTGKGTIAWADYSHAGGDNSKVYEEGLVSRVDGYDNENWGPYSAIDGYKNKNKSENTFIAGANNEVDNASKGSFVGGIRNNIKTSMYTTIGGNGNIVQDSPYSFVAGQSNEVHGKLNPQSGQYMGGSIVTGQKNKVFEGTDNAHVSGYNNNLSGGNSYTLVSGYDNVLTGSGNSIVIGNKHTLSCKADASSNSGNFVVGTNNKTNRSYTVLQGHSLIIDRGDNYQYVRGRFNVPGDYIDVVAYGDNDVPVESDDPTKKRVGRKNLYTLDRKGNAIFTGTVSSLGEISQPYHLTRKDYVDGKIDKFLSLTGNWFDEVLPTTIYYKPIYDDAENSWQVKDTNGNKLSTEEGSPVYDFENLQFVTSQSNGTYKLVKLYSYSDEWNNTRYTLNPNYTFCLKPGTTVHELSEGIEEDKKFLDGLRMEAKYSESSESRYNYKDSRGALLAGDHVVANGQRSLVAGQYNFVNGDFAGSLGHTNSVRGKNAMAFGYGNIANGHNATALNESNKVLGYGSLGYGDNNVVLGTDSIIGGWQNQLRGNYSFITGARNIAYGEYIGGFGFNNLYNGMYNFGNGSTNIINGNYNNTNGYKNTINGNNNTVNGNTNTINSTGNSVVGSNNIIHESSSSVNLINGTNNEIIPASSYRSLISGYQNKIVSGGGYNLVVGITNNIYSRLGVALGEGLEVEGYTGAQVVIGRYNVKDTYCQFIVGNGTSTTDRKNIFAVQRDGRATLGADPKYALDAVTKQYSDGAITNLRNEFLKAGNLPAVSASNNGQILMVVDGIWKSSTKLQEIENRLNQLGIFEEASF